MSLQIKYRFKSLDDIVGNKGIVSSIRSVLERDKEDIPHAFLFHGPKGCGKTSMARIIAEALDCDSASIMEYDIGDMGGIETVRTLKEACQYLPIMGNVRVYVLDEVQSMTKPAQDALLKTLEEPPNHVYFVLCTTEPERLKETIRSRCHMYMMKPLNSIEMGFLLNRILKEEGIEDYPKTIIKEIIFAAEGSPRNALKALDAVIDITDEKSALEALASFSTTDATLKELCQSLLQGTSWDTLRGIVKQLELDNEPESLRIGILNYMNTVLLGSKRNDRVNDIIQNFSMATTMYHGKSVFSSMVYTMCPLVSETKPFLNKPNEPAKPSLTKKLTIKGSDPESKRKGDIPF